MSRPAPKKIRKLLVANRGEIAIRVLRAANELGIRTVAIFSDEDRFALHRFKADESYGVGKGNKPIRAYLDIEDILRVARDAGVDAIHPGYGFLSENPDFADACTDAGITFIGPDSDVMRSLGNKVSARNMAEAAGVPVMPASAALPDDIDEVAKIARQVGYPIMLKASWGGGGRGMRVIENGKDLAKQVLAAKREAEAAFGNGEIYFEKLIRRARHVEVQMLGDTHGTLVHLFERDCSVQRRNQKVVERAPAPYLSEDQRTELCEAAMRLGKAANYVNAGTVEFLMDVDTSKFYFIEVNPRIQVEHTVTECVTGLDLVKAQILIAQGGRIGFPSETGIPWQDKIKLRDHALQCRITTENPENNFVPDYGRIKVYRGANGFGIRLDGGTAYSGAVITPFYDSMLEKVTAWGSSPREAVDRMDRALREFRIRGVTTNLAFLENLINHPKFRAGDYTTRFIDETPELFKFARRRDRATRLLRFIGEVSVNGNPEVAGRAEPANFNPPVMPKSIDLKEIRPGTKQKLDQLGPEGFSRWMKDQKRVLMTDTTMRDAHQSLIATRMRTFDMLKIAPYYAHGLSDLFSIECWGGATFDVAMRFLKEDPWDRLVKLREAVPNILTQMLLRASNAVGYTNYPDNAVDYFVKQAAEHGMDVFRVFDSLNWVENMKVAMDSVLRTGKLCEGAICYTGDIFDKDRSKYNLDYYVEMARELEKSGAHILGLKDMAGLLRPAAATTLFQALKDTVNIPIHFHTHDTSGISAATVMAAIDAGVDAVDGALDSMSGLTSQPNLGSIAQAYRGLERDPGLNPEALREVSTYWEQVRRYYTGFESDIRSGTSDVYVHEMPGGQYTNLRHQARAVGLEERWSEVSKAYAHVNKMFGDIVKVTPSSKVVGDMALMMVTSGLTENDVLDPKKDIAFPDSVISFFRGEIGQPVGGFPPALQRKVLKGGEALSDRPGKHMKPIDFVATKAEIEKKTHRNTSDAEVASYVMYPKVFLEYAEHRSHNADVSILPTPVFFYGMNQGEEISVDIEKGKTLVIRYLATSEFGDDEGQRTVFFELNGQPRTVKVADNKLAVSGKSRPKAEDGNPMHVAAPMPGLVVEVSVVEGQKIKAGDVICALEAMKMETAVHAEKDGTVAKIHAPAGTQVDSKDLLVELTE
ncbi:pyruvate carboxylase [uncultured Thalassospira sp.]|jgi:pyruvate carboxylase|uniref:pyruvate carboxylase n=1 Tax=uncultured Thalassospira sp. TaxID=404382 RepID=UPI0030DB36F6|tara:strand:- start:35534 stop:39001 length:3468 start_codon:yes stop_codon:yes gene_type:complete